MTFISTLRQLVPNYDSIVKAHELGPTIKPTIRTDREKYTVLLEEVWYDEEEAVYYGSANPGSESLDQRVDWVTEELSKWPNVRRTAWDMWQFKRKRDAEKFITLYSLVWA